ncbi:hypothetical protein H0H92_015173 [Tricholoma furcatifolium]|nr:hypothetical protein H0H92_015173 [Tricholoma furcatifolium]
MRNDFYQIGGFRPHLQWWHYGKDQTLIEEVAGTHSPLRSPGNEYIELVLGIKPTGTSHLLMTEPQVKSMVRAYRKPYPSHYTSASEFESLSPIYFRSKDEFQETFRRLKITSTKKGRENWDNSPENKPFSLGSLNLRRGSFEHGRSAPDAIDVNKFNLGNLTWVQAAAVYSFAFSLRAPDTRSREDRMRYPLQGALDCGLARATIPYLHYQEGSAIHYIFSNNRVLGQGPKSPKLRFLHGETKELVDLEIVDMIRNFFSAMTNNGATEGASAPIILLVHDEEVAMSILKACGVDTSNWKSGLKDILYNIVSRNESRNRYSRQGDSGNRHDYHANNNRNRSRSPRRPSGSESGWRQGDFSPVSRRSFAPVYVVDIKPYYSALMQTDVGSERVSRIASSLKLQDINGWCAGNDVVTILNIWRAMVSGSSIDQQRAERNKNINLGPQTQSTGASSYDLDDPTTYQPVAEGVDDDDDSDWGQSSDDD